MSTLTPNARADSYCDATVAFVQASYAAGCPNHEWLQGLARGLLAWLPAGTPTAAVLFERVAPGGPARTSVAETEGHSHWPGWLPLPDETLWNDVGVAVSLSRRLEVPEGASISVCRVPVARALGAHAERIAVELAMCSVRTADDVQLSLVAVVQADGRQGFERFSRTWNSIAAHLAVAVRLRRMLGALLGSDPLPALAERRGLAFLCNRARRLAVSNLASNEQRLLEPRGVWSGWASGRYALVEQVEEEGQRYLLFRENEPTLTDPRALTRREQAVTLLSSKNQPDRFIAKDLGLSLSTVCGHRSRALKKLGMHSRAQAAYLIRLLLGTKADLSADAVLPTAGGHATAESSPVTATSMLVGGDRLIVVNYPSPQSALPSGLTEAERAVALLLLEGLRNREIARLRGTSVRTVANQTRSIFAKLGLSGRMALACELS